ncbi:hypothetical protein AB0G54_40725 [Streptomyces yokosukanensis]|uniref:hypothetical protein n=1 Tax=Streptomyces yokosukanensis TaxID=67386 RepID=UPI00343E76AA
MIVDERAELFLVAGRHEEDEAQAAGTALIRLDQLGANPDALKAAQAIAPEKAGTAVLASGDGWERVRSHLIAEADAEDIAAAHAHLTPALPELSADPA